MGVVSLLLSVSVIAEKLCLTDAQVNAGFSRIKAHQAEVEDEYQQVWQIAEDNRQYWDERNRERFARLAATPLKLGQEAIVLSFKLEKTGLSPRCESFNRLQFEMTSSFTAHH
jgi:hypothetical protein